MISPQEFMNYLQNGEIPPSAPYGTSIFGNDLRIYLDDETLWKIKSECKEEYMMWAIVTREWTERLADWIGDRKCLEIMAGSGWLSKALSEFGVDIIATDDFSWGFHKKHRKYVFPIEKMNATLAIRLNTDREILIVSWPYMDRAIEYACREWGNERPIVYIGEDYGGCTATDYFHKNFQKDHSAPRIPLLTWPGIHDEIMIGKWINKT